MSKCLQCSRTVYQMDPQLNLDGSMIHKECAKCNDCAAQLSVSNHRWGEEGTTKILLCRTHYDKRVKEGVSYVNSRRSSLTEEGMTAAASAAAATAASSALLPPDAPVEGGSVAERRPSLYNVALKKTTSKAGPDMVPAEREAKNPAPFGTKQLKRTGSLIMQGGDLSKPSKSQSTEGAGSSASAASKSMYDIKALMRAKSLETRSSVKLFGGKLVRFSHKSTETGTLMTCSVFIPPGVVRDDVTAKIPCLLYLSGLTCTDENVCQKSGIFKKLAQYKIALIAPDTSPRGAGIEGEDESWDFGTGAGFYLDAAVEPWSTNYRMYSYITEELFSLMTAAYPCIDLEKKGIFGHSMGGHGALTIALKNQSMFRSVSAFAPICNPMNCPWGVKAFDGYLGLENKALRTQCDATELLRACGAPTKFDDILIDVGTADNFYKAGQLLPEAFEAAAQEVGQKISLRYQEGYDHSYFFVSSFIEDHVDFHAHRLFG